MHKHLVLAVAAIALAGGLVLSSKPTVPATHTDLRQLSKPLVMGAPESDIVTMSEIGAAEEARLAAARRLARQKRHNAFSIDGTH